MHPVLKTVLGRLAMGFVTLFVVSIIIFSSMELLPGDFGQAVLGQAATEETVAAFRRELGLDQPAIVRYGQWIAAALQGDLGTSFSGRNASGVDRSREVIDLVAPRLQNTLFLASVAALIAVPLALILGITTALYRNSFFDRSVNMATLTTISFPEFFCGVYFDFVSVFALSYLPIARECGCRYAIWRALVQGGFACTNADFGDRCAYDADDAGGHHQPVGQPLYSNGPLIGGLSKRSDFEACFAKCLGAHCDSDCVQPGVFGGWGGRGRSGVCISRHRPIDG